MPTIPRFGLTIAVSYAKHLGGIEAITQEWGNLFPVPPLL